MNLLLTRRQMLARTGTGFGLLALADLFARAEEPRIVLPHHPPKAKRCIFLYMPGGPSQMDLFDPKPRVLAENGMPLPFEKPKLELTKTGTLFASPWKFSKHGQCGADVSELLPHIAERVDDLCVIRSMVADNINHTGAATAQLARLLPQWQQATGMRTAGGAGGGLGRIAGYGPGWFETSRKRDFNMLPVKTRYTFEMTYDPAGAGGAGEFVFTLGGDGPFTGGPFKYTLPPDLRKSGATFDAFGIINGQAGGGPMTAYFDDLTIDGRRETFERDPQWLAQNNRAQHGDHGVHGAHRFGFSDTAFAGGQRGEIGGLFFSAPQMPGNYADRVGR